MDFINYITKRNDYDRKFTIGELYEKFKVQKHNCELNQLKEFLELTGKYTDDLASGKSMNEIFTSMAHKHDLKYVGEDGTYHYTDVIRDRIGKSEMHSWDAIEVDEENR